MFSKKSAVTFLLGVFLICSGFICTGSQVHQVSVANADLASALNNGTKAVIDLHAQGVFNTAEQAAILPKINDASILSDRIQDCTEAVNAAKTLTGCVTPLIRSVRDDINAASLGIKNTNTQASLKTALTLAITAVNAIASVGGIN